MAEWRASGQTSEAFSEGKPFTAGGLRHWGSRLKAGRGGRSRNRPRVVRVDRVQPRGAAEGLASPGPSLVLELGPARVVVRPGFDRATLAALLEVALATVDGRAA